MSTEVSFGEWLRRKRKALDLTREELAKRVGYSAATIRKIEDEERHPSIQIVERLAEVFKIPQNERSDFLRFGRGDLKSAPVETDEDRPWRAPGKAPRSNIPATTTSLIAREKEIALVREYLSKDNIRLVTLMGPPGIGKTRLSIEVARASLHDFPDGVFFVPLALLDDPGSIAPAIIQMLGYLESGHLSAEKQLMKGIGDKRMLIVLDNCEHLIEGVTAIASDLLSACSHLKMLATSRESFRILGEWLYPVPAFDIPRERDYIDLNNASDFPALMLFEERARAVRPDFQLTDDNIQKIAAICAHLDGLPLVIELIAARTRLMSLQTLLERLSGQFVLTADGMRAPSERQRTLRNAIDWSYNLLSAQEQKLFVYLSVFSGGFTLADAEAIFANNFTEKSVPELLTLLLDKSLIRRVIKESDEDHYEMLVTIHEYARERLRQVGEETEVRNRHLAYFLDLAESADKELRGPNQLEWLRRLVTEVDNLRASLDWAIETNQTETALEVVRKLHWFWFVRSEHTEGAQWLQRVLEIPNVSIHPKAQAEALAQLAHHLFIKTGDHEARPFAEQALSIARVHNDKHNSARALVILGLIFGYKGDFASAQRTWEESKALYRDVNDEWGYAHAVMCTAIPSWRQEDWETALDLSQRALRIFQKLGDKYFQSVMLRHCGYALMQQEDLTSGRAALRESLALAQQLGSKYELAQTLWRFADLDRFMDRMVDAVRLYWASRNMLDSIGAWWQEDDEIFRNNLAACRAALDESAFAQTVEEGRTMTMEQAIAYALDQEF